MSHEPSDFPNRFRAHVELQGAILTPEELSHVGECYPRCRGKDHWDVRAYASVTGIGAREYIQLGRREESLASLRRGFEIGDVNLATTNCDPEYAPLRADPRYQDLRRRMGLR